MLKLRLASFSKGSKITIGTRTVFSCAQLTAFCYRPISVNIFYDLNLCCRRTSSKMLDWKIFRAGSSNWRHFYLSHRTLLAAVNFAYAFFYISDYCECILFAILISLVRLDFLCFFKRDWKFYNFFILILYWMKRTSVFKQIL